MTPKQGREPAARLRIAVATLAELRLLVRDVLDARAAPRPPASVSSHVNPRPTPRNTRTREQRLALWKEEAAAGRKFAPVPVSGPKARWQWLDAIKRSGLTPTERLAAVMLALYGRSDGTKVYPGVRALAADTGLSQKAVVAQVRNLVRAGRLWRKPRKNGGFEYVLCIPKKPDAVLTPGAHSEADSANPGCTLTESANPGAKSANPDAQRVRTLGSPIMKGSINRSWRDARRANPTGSRATDATVDENDRRRAAELAARRPVPKP